MAVYATVDDLEDEIALPANPDRLLILASTEVDALLAGAVYTTDDQGAPTEPSDIEKLRRLTVLQAVWMADDPDGLKDHWTSLTTGSTSATRQRTRPRFAPRAVSYLGATGWPGAGIRVVR